MAKEQYYFEAILSPWMYVVMKQKQSIMQYGDTFMDKIIEQISYNGTHALRQTCR
jgi:hypothetical protein